MTDLIVIVGDHGDLWRSFPVVARRPGETLVFLDHRMPIRDRVEMIRGLAPWDFLEVVKIPIPVADCDQGLHDWEPVERGAMVVAATCLACREMAPLNEPLACPHRRLAVAN